MTDRPLKTLKFGHRGYCSISLGASYWPLDFKRYAAATDNNVKTVQAIAHIDCAIDLISGEYVHKPSNELRMLCC